jgi:hypothetical protein
MNKLLPILLVVVLSGCGQSAFEKECIKRFKINNNMNPSDSVGLGDGSFITVKEYCYERGVAIGAIR